MTSIILIILLAALVGWAVVHTVRKSQKGGGCCGEHEAAPKRISVGDKNKSHYPYQRTLSIGGMTCENCAIRVENALNALPGTWAKVDIAEKTALVRFKTEPDEAEIRKAVSAAGYTVMEIK